MLAGSKTYDGGPRGAGEGHGPVVAGKRGSDSWLARCWHRPGQPRKVVRGCTRDTGSGCGEGEAKELRVARVG